MKDEGRRTRDEARRGEYAPIIVVGGGAAGLTTAYYLEEAGLPYVVLEKGTVGYSWQRHYDSLRLHTLKEVSALPGLPMPNNYPDFPPKDLVSAYLQAYTRHFSLNVEERTAVTEATFHNGQWQLTTAQGPRCADVLIVATGIWSSPRCPEFGGEEHFNGRIIQANAYQNPEPFRGQRVLVIGAGNTGTEIAVELGNAGIETGIVVRSGIPFVPYPTSPTLMRLLDWFTRTAPAALGDFLLGLVRPDFSEIGLPPHPDPPTEAYPVVGFELPQAVRAGKVSVYGAVDHFTAEGVQFGDGRQASFDAVILATGYRPTIDFIQPRPQLDERGRVIARGDHPRLHTVGFYYPATAGWLQSIGRVARGVVKDVEEDLRHASSPKH